MNTLAEFLDEPAIAVMTPVEARDAAKAYSVIQYTNIAPSLAEQFFATNGVLNSIIDGQTNTMAVTVQLDLNGDGSPDFSLAPTTVGMLCKAIIGTIAKNNDGFANNPSKLTGMVNRAASQLLVDNGIMPQAISDSFFQQGQTTVYPLANTTLKDVLVHRGQMVYKDVNININAVEERDWLLVQFMPSLNPDFEPYTPQIYRMVHGDYKRLNGFEKPVETDGGYKVFINKNRGTFYVDDPYSVVV